MTGGSGSSAGGGKGRETLALRLRARQPELVELALLHALAVAPLPELVDQEYAQGLRAAADKAMDFGIRVVEAGTGAVPPIPAVLLVQARLAARHRVSLDAVQRRYIAGHAVLAKAMIEEMERGGSGDGDREALQVVLTLLDRIIDAVSEEHARESRLHVVGTKEQRRVDAVERLLRGELLVPGDFSYDFDARHVGIIAAGEGAADATRALAKALDRRLLIVRPADGRAWGWLEVRDDLDWTALEREVGRNWPGSVDLAVGDDEKGMVGWRRTHNQARAAMALAVTQPGQIARYGPNCMLITALNDELFREALRSRCLEPLSRGRSGNRTLQDTLRAYFKAKRNATSTSAAIGVSRRTVTTRIRKAEQLIGQTITECGSMLEPALALELLELRANSQKGAFGDSKN